MAECAVLLTLAFIFRLIANDALKALSHDPDFNAFAFRAQSPHGRVLPDCVQLTFSAEIRCKSEPRYAFSPPVGFTVKPAWNAAFRRLHRVRAEC
jgi:hypothetical protein